MNITVKEAIKHFFACPSFEMIYSEAVANALDAGADNISIGIEIKNFQAKETIRMIIRDNGRGFTDENFRRFKSLLQSKDANHKGLGRLVYLAYFNKVHVESSYDGTKHRIFDFSDDFNGECLSTSMTKPEESYSSFAFTEFSNTKFSKYDDLKPSAVKDLLKKLFMARLFMMRAEKKKLQIDISLDVEEGNPARGFVSGRERLTLEDLPDLKELKFKATGFDLFNDDFQLLYVVLHDNWRERATSAICVDGRAIPFPIFKSADLPNGASAIFLLQSKFFDSKADDARQEVKLDTNEHRAVTRLFQEKVSAILLEELPDLKSRNDKVKEDLATRYPHLSGYFQGEGVGIINSARALEEARDRFFKEQREILEAKELTEELYLRSLNHATRVLAEYVLYRNLIIRKLESINPRDRESSIHNIIVPMQRVFDKATAEQDLYNNNAWVLDDKYMSYSSVLSDKNLKELIEKISGPDELKATDIRPDIALVFSDDIETATHPVDVVIVELKKKELNYLDNMTVLNQIKMRARRLASLYPQKIQRMWFFGVVDFEADKELKIEMREGKWASIYSSAGTVFYNQINVTPTDKDRNPLSDHDVPVSVTLMSYDAMIGDAKVRNESFLSILKRSISQFASQAML